MTARCTSRFALGVLVVLTAANRGACARPDVKATRTAAVDVAISTTGPALASIDLVGTTADIAGHGAPTLIARNSRYTNDEAAYTAVRTHPDLMIVSDDFLHDLPNLPADPIVGEQAVLRNPTTGTTRTVTVFAVQGDTPSGITRSPQPILPTTQERRAAWFRCPGFRSGLLK